MGYAQALRAHLIVLKLVGGAVPKPASIVDQPFATLPEHAGTTAPISSAVLNSNHQSGTEPGQLDARNRPSSEIHAEGPRGRRYVIKKLAIDHQMLKAIGW